MNQSEEIKDLVTALAKAQGQMKPAIFNKGNPHFKSRYADFTSCMDACRAPLSENGLSIMQYCETVNDKFVLVTMLAHVSGQWIKSHFPLYPAKMDSQGIGSAMSYAKRYSLSALIGLVSDDEDDDGEREQGRPAPVVKPIDTIDELQCKAIEEGLVGKEDLKKAIIGAYKAINKIPRDKFTAVMKKIADVKPVETKEEEYPF